MSSVDHDPDRHPDFDRPLPEGWTLAGLGVIADSLTYGYTASATAGSHGPRFLRITDIQNGRVDWNSVPTCMIDEAAVRKYGLAPGDIVFARTGATTGKSFLIRSCPLAVFASYLIRLRLLPEINPALLDYFFQTPDYWAFISDNVAGIAQPNCNATKLAELQIPIPPSGEQQRLVEAIAVLLSKVGRARNHLSRVPAILKRFRQAVLAAACSGKLTEDLGLADPWTETRLGNLALEIRTGPFGSALHKSDYVYGGIPVVNPTNIVHGKIVPKDDISVSKETFRRLEEYALRRGDIIIARRGEMGRCAVVCSREEGWLCGTGSALLRLKKAAMPHFVQMFISSPEGRLYLSEGSVGSTMDNLNQKLFATMPVSLPSVEEQQDIVRRVERLFDLANAIESRVFAASSQADKLTQSILAKAFRGELVPTEAELARREGREYEPASVLLERIKKEREFRTFKKPERRQTGSRTTKLATAKR